MSTQRTLQHLRRSPFYSRLSEFVASQSKEITFGTDTTSEQREDIRQICKHLDLSFKTTGVGSQKKITVLKWETGFSFKGPDWTGLEFIGVGKAKIVMRFKTVKKLGGAEGGGDGKEEVGGIIL